MSSLYTPRLQEHLDAIERALPAYLPKAEGYLQATVMEAMAYACAAGGKRLRPVLTLECCRLCCGDAERALPFAAAVEMIHSYSLVHDDLPCMDNSPLRRGRPSVHAAYGEDMALLAGDGLLNLAFETMLNPENRGQVTAEQALSAAFALGRASGIYGMVGGQVIDLQSEGKSIDLHTLRTLQEGKTAALITAACEMGCRCASGTREQEAALREYGWNLGLCFQMIDDILDVTSTPEALGKPVGSDAENEKTTYVSLLGLSEVRRLAGEHTRLAEEALRGFGPEGDDLCRLAQSLLARVQ